MWQEKISGRKGRAGKEAVNWRIVNAVGQEPPTPEEITIAKLDGICPRCDAELELVEDGCLCTACRFSF